ncbi:unnamed protein product [Gongylonema pulchrum]|uniref:WD_REPEATS_REGION domain-containing protein n=1 Tax=Gongylonema pulchrum TaxID=637853 RepID=A0A183D1W5_9BILA|nr:unnamed protein product [Gongylonema pulchrum]
MPDVSNTVAVSPDGRHIFATGTYKPFLKCFDVNDLSLKFSRGLDADVVKLTVLSEDYSKVSFPGACMSELVYALKNILKTLISSSSSEIYRLNLEEGKFLEPLVTSSPSLTCCEFNNEHQLFVCGTSDGRIEAWDHRDASRCGILDCAVHLQSEYSKR